ncbi:cobyrinate a,c-diamide synthase [Nocardioides gansuensis]|uniref:cobyrinate a,c-diamide synthase n=1 Tax=Nocardioides gansuensis TaxID=2138300 RepID=UPI001403D793|nr:cobyrinate a,c-diamide synthase [Nocardioides gansuensis]
MTALPRLVVAAPASGHGKTTVATGLMAALRRAGHVVSGHKVGPDYIDPGYHALATGRPGRNLDPHLVGEERLVPLLLHGAQGAGLAVIEGVMGLYDGQLGADGFASTAHVAEVTRSPVVLVVDISHASRSVAAVVHGLRTWRPGVDVVGVVLNKAGSPRHAAEVVASLADDVPVLGVLHRDDGIEAPSRHLGLVPAAERDDAGRALDRLAARVAEHVDLDAVVRLARSAPDLPGTPWSPGIVRDGRTLSGVAGASARHGLPRQGSRPRIAVAGGRAFTFRYAETEELLRAAGAEVVELDPLRDERLPEGTTGLYLGGGFPEVHTEDLAANERLRRELREAIAAGLPTVAECAGLLYLCRTVQGREGPPAPMVGALDADAGWAPRLTLAYRTATAPGDDLLSRAGERVTGHEFHRTHLLAEPGGDPAWLLGDDRAAAGVATATLHASYLHVHWAGHPHLAARFLAAAAAHETSARRPGRDPSYSSRRPEPDLRHHGDRELGEGRADFAVNVYDAPRPPWLDLALHRAIDELAAYPDPAPAEAAIAARHGRDTSDVLATAGAAEAFGLVARLRAWRAPVVVHPQFTEPDVALQEAGRQPRHVVLEPPFALDPASVPDDADLVVVGNPTNPTGVLHPVDALLGLRREGRLVVVDEAFCDDDAASLAGGRHEGLLVVRSLTKLWAVPGLRAGYVLGEPDTVEALRRTQTPWSVSTPAIAAMRATATAEAREEARRRVETMRRWREHLHGGLAALGVHHVPSTTAFVLARPGAGVHEALQDKGFAVRRCDTFPGLDGSWIRIAVRDERSTDALLDALSAMPLG